MKSSNHINITSYTWLFLLVVLLYVIKVLFFLDDVESLTIQVNEGSLQMFFTKCLGRMDPGTEGRGGWWAHTKI